MSSQCKHLRFRDSNNQNLDVETLVKTIEKQFNIDIRKLPMWKELVKRLHVTYTDCQQKKQNAHLRKLMIIDKLYMQTTRISPFSLTEQLARTSEKWKKIQKNNQKRIVIHSKPDIKMLSDTFDYFDNFSPKERSGSPDISDQLFSVHHNTEVSAANLYKDSEIDGESVTTHLPLNISINKHSLVSPPPTLQSSISKYHMSVETTYKEASKMEEWKVVKMTKFVKSDPEILKITNDTLNEQTINFSLVNYSNEYLYVQFKKFIDFENFKNAKMYPLTPVKLYPGLPVKFSLNFKLKESYEITSWLYFRVGRNILLELPFEGICINMIKRKPRSTVITEIVNLPPAYAWQLTSKIGFPIGFIDINVTDNFTYEVRIKQRQLDYTKEPKNVSMESLGVATISLLQMLDDTKSELFSNDSTEALINVKDIVTFLIEEILVRAMDAFFIEHTCFKLEPFAKKRISVCLTKAERIGDHQCCYDVDFYDPKIDEILFTKTTRVFASILPHPVVIVPDFLDMTQSPVNYGFYEDHITLTNTLRKFNVNIKIKLTSRIKKLLHVSPLSLTMPGNSSARINVKFCARDLIHTKEIEDFVHFTLKIIFTGHKSIYENVPPRYYEIMAPCAFEFNQVYSNCKECSLQEQSYSVSNMVLQY